MITAFRKLHTGRLVLTPRDPKAAIAPLPLADRLRNAGLIGQPLPDRGGAFETGDRFLQLLAFTGCAVQLDTKSIGAGTAFTHITLQGPYATPQLLSGRNTRPPCCPVCGRALGGWRARVQQSTSDQAPNLCCEHCAAVEPGWRWTWGRNGGFGCSFVCVEEVFPGEAAPLPVLFETLLSLGVGDWRHFFVQA
ncbi:MAG: hypothetical protein WBG92_20230 [Thiohalocapsa sp.]